MALDDNLFWRVAEASRMSVIVDAEDYFRNARDAMLKARHRIMLVGWDFDARIRLTYQERRKGEPETVGEFIYWLVERTPKLEVFLLRWDIGAIKTLFRGTNILTVAKWMMHPRIHTKLDSIHPAGGSHHQKIVVLDECLAFCGGIDMTCARWDTRQHCDHEPKRVLPNGKSYPPWHDATTALQGPIATALDELCRDRWHWAGGKPINAIQTDSDCWPDLLEPDFRNVVVGIARTHPAMPEIPEVREIEALFVYQIASARHTIYAESQYFASRRIAEAIAGRLGDPDGPEIIIINPQSAQGWLEPVAMDTARARLFTALKQRDTYDRLRIYHPFTASGEPIYVHAKVMIIDQQLLRIGSANMNNRSMGLDTECDVVIDAEETVADAVLAVRDGLLAEHLAVPRERVTSQIAASGSVIAAIEILRGQGRSLRPYEIPNLTDVEAWLADNQVLDPEGTSDMFEAQTKRKPLLHRLRHH